MRVELDGSFLTPFGTNEEEVSTAACKVDEPARCRLGPWRPTLPTPLETFRAKGATPPDTVALCRDGPELAVMIAGKDSPDTSRCAAGAARAEASRAAAELIGELAAVTLGESGLVTENERPLELMTT